MTTANYYDEKALSYQSLNHCCPSLHFGLCWLKIKLSHPILHFVSTKMNGSPSSQDNSVPKTSGQQSAKHQFWSLFTIFVSFWQNLSIVEI